MVSTITSRTFSRHASVVDTGSNINNIFEMEQGSHKVLANGKYHHW